ncbi:sigma factor [Amycolatopsis sp. SID8362]|uniref:sigma factor n=1 Tax=Amycolatopsis sp. SID8362 TaxID=2690346 RepID=UPI001EF33C79|nr:sigma factor [Amycolatopsis sp. SID8362]
MLRSIASRILGSVTEAEDAVQESCLRYGTTRIRRGPRNSRIRCRRRHWSCSNG